MSSLRSLRRRQSKGGHGQRARTGLLQSQLILFNSRRKWGLLYSLATVAGLSCVPGVTEIMAGDSDTIGLIEKTAPMPLISLLVATGMYILNDLVDSDLDKANGKKRPIPSGMVSKNQAWIFIVSTNSLAAILSAVTLNIVSVLILLPMLAIGIMYSAPRVALMNRFVIKTLSISVFYAMCVFLGITSSYGIEPAVTNPAVPIYSMSLLGIMIFISSTLNDLGDIEGDKSAKRRTIPIVLGSSATIRLLIVLALGMVSLSIVAYETIGLIAVIATVLFSMLVISKLKKIGEGLAKMDIEAIRKQHRKIFPLHMLLQLLLVVGAVIVV